MTMRKAPFLGQRPGLQMNAIVGSAIPENAQLGNAILT
jgi:hypothetical protein